MKKNRVVTAGLSLALALSFGAPAVTAFAETSPTEPAAEAAAPQSEQNATPEEQSAAQATPTTTPTEKQDTTPSATLTSEPTQGEAPKPAEGAAPVQAGAGETEAQPSAGAANEAPTESSKPMTKQDLENQGNQVVGTNLDVTWTVDGKAVKNQWNLYYGNPYGGHARKRSSVSLRIRSVQLWN